MEQNVDSLIGSIATERHAKGSTPGLRPEEVVKHYNDWSKDSTYDMQSADLYKGPSVAAAAVCYHLEGRTDVSVLDMAAGTGKVGAQLKKHGFKHVDALEPSTGMLNTAKSNDTYRNYFDIFFTDNVPALKSNSYDVVVCSGGMMAGHLMCSSLKEMVRIVKADGLVVIVMREEYLQTVAEYTDRLEPYMRQLETDGHWVPLDRTVIPHYFSHFNGIRYVFRVTAAM